MCGMRHKSLHLRRVMWEPIPITRILWQHMSRTGSARHILKTSSGMCCRSGRLNVWPETYASDVREIVLVCGCIAVTICNARACLAVADADEDFATLIWNIASGTPIQNTWHGLRGSLEELLLRIKAGSAV
jgi:hypothetical protein